MNAAGCPFGALRRSTREEEERGKLLPSFLTLGQYQIRNPESSLESSSMPAILSIPSESMKVPALITEP